MPAAFVMTFRIAFYIHLFYSNTYKNNANDVAMNSIGKNLTPWWDSNPWATVPLAETMTTTPRR
jgi:hypothetical protein